MEKEEPLQKALVKEPERPLNKWKKVKKKRRKKRKKERLEEEKKDDGEMNDWDFLYSALELFTNNRKRNQMVLLHNIIFKIKEEFNKEFNSML